MTMDAPALASTYGADEHGLVCGYRLQAHGPGEPVGSEVPTTPTESGDTFVWLHFNLAHAGAERRLRALGGLPQGFFDALHEGSRSTRIERDGDALLAVINDLTFDFDFEASDVATLWACARGGLVVTARRHPLRSVDRLRAAVKRGEPVASPAALIDHLLRDQADELVRIVRRITERVDDIEDALLAGHHHTHATELSRLRRLAVRLQRLLAPEPASLLRLLGNPPAWMAMADIERLRQASEEFAVVLRDIGALHERVKLLQEETNARVNEENNRSLFTLTMVTVLALPINLVSGLFGMNVGGIPWGEHPHGFRIMVGLIATITALAAWLAWRRVRQRR